MPSWPREFHPEPLTEPDVILSHHPARVTARRLPPSAERSGSSRFNPVGPCSTAMTCPLCSAGITPLHCYYEAVRPSPAHRYFRPRGWSRLCFFPWHRRPGPHVPYRSLVKLRAAYTGGLRSAPDCRPRRSFLHLQYSCASPFGPALLVTQDPYRKSALWGRSHSRRKYCAPDKEQLY